MTRFKIGMGVVALCLAASAAYSQATPPALQKNQPIEISSDKLDVVQPEHKAIFAGNVIAIQGTTNMRAAQMVVFYRDNAPASTPPAAAEKPSVAQGIYRIEATGSVVFTTPTEIAIGETAIYNVDSDTIDLVGGNVTLTRGQNILKGTKLNYNMATGRSVLTGGVSGATASGKPPRVHGLFVPKADEKPKAKP